MCAQFTTVLDLESGTSKLMVTTRLKGIMHHGAQFELGLLSEHDAVALMLECAGERLKTKPTPLMLRAVELCGTFRS